MFLAKPFPQELTDQFIDSVNDRFDWYDSNIRNLGACSLVCKDWLRRSRIHIFDDVLLTPNSIGTFCELLKSPHSTIGSFVRCVRIDSEEEVDEEDEVYPEYDWMDDLISNLHLLSLARKLALSCLHWEGLENRRKSILSSFQNIQELELAKVVGFETLGSVFDVICSFTLLEKVYVDVEWDDGSLDVPDVQVLPSGLRDLELRCCANDQVLVAILSYQGLPAISTLHLANLAVNHVPSSASLLQALGSKLQHLEIMFVDSEAADAFGEHIDLSNNTELLSLRIYDWSWHNYAKGPTVFACLPRLLTQITSTKVRRIDLGICLKTVEDIESPAWRTIEENLARPQFFKLNCISFGLSKPITLDGKMLALSIKRQLPSCDARGLLTGLDG